MSRVAHARFLDGCVVVSPRPGAWRWACMLSAPGLRLVRFSGTRELVVEWRRLEKRRLRLERGVRVRWQIVATRPGWPPRPLALPDGAC